MAKAIDSSYLLKHQRKVKFFGLGPDDESWGYAVPTEIIENAPTLTPPNEPLTLEQLREMDGEPVYIVFSPDVDGEKLQFWALVAVDEWDDVYLANKDEWAFNYEEFLEDVEAIYRRPPEGEEDT